MLEAPALGLNYICRGALRPLAKVSGKVLQCEITNNFVYKEFEEGNRFETWWTFLTIEDEHVSLLGEEGELPKNLQILRKICEIKPITSFLTEGEMIEKTRQEKEIWRRSLEL